VLTYEIAIVAPTSCDPNRSHSPDRGPRMSRADAVHASPRHDEDDVIG
jgi:hypothetical protein